MPTRLRNLPVSLSTSCLLVINLVIFISLEVEARSKVLLVSFDAFRYDYYDIYKPKSFQQLAANGVHANEGIIPTFATKTFPNHYTIVTGLYEEVHGIIDNDMYDPEFNEVFNLATTSVKWWDAGEPIWITAKKHGLTTAAAFWPGSNVDDSKRRPTYYVGYDPKITFEDRVNQAVKWLTKDKVDFVALYFQEPDYAGHKYGIMTPQVENAIAKVDATLSHLLNSLTTSKIIDQVDLIVLGDHGMVNTSNVPADDSKVIYLDQYIDMQDVMNIPQTGTLAGIYPKPGKLEKIYTALKKANIKHVTVYKKENLPDEWHYKNHRRIMPIVIVAEETYIIAKSKSEIDVYTIGQHGYDNNLKSMRPIFFAQGPSFKKSLKIKPFSNINIYSLLCHLLEVTPAPNNGSAQVFKNILKFPPNNNGQPLQFEILMLLAGALCILFGIKLSEF